MRRGGNHVLGINLCVAMIPPCAAIFAAETILLVSKLV